jgi:hypothetical protein
MFFVRLEASPKSLNVRMWITNSLDPEPDSMNPDRKHCFMRKKIKLRDYLMYF